MMLTELVVKNRSYRGFDRSRRVTREELEEMVSCARLTPSAVNRQPLKYALSWTDEVNRRIQPLTAWAGLLKPGRVLPEAGHEPVAFIVMCVDTRICADPRGADRDLGIAAQTILLRAVEMGLGGCMIGAFKPEIKTALALPEYAHPALVLAIGKPDETVLLEDAGDSVAYYRDENDVHHVPKRTLSSILLSIG